MFTRPSIAQQTTLPVAHFVEEAPHDALPVATQVRVVDPAAMRQVEPILTITEGDDVPPNDEAVKSLARRSCYVTLFLLTLLACALGGGGYAVYRFAIEPSLNQKGAVSVSRSTPTTTRSPTSPTPPTTRSPTNTKSPTPPTPEVYGIELVFAPTPLPTPIRNAFEDAKERWQTILVEPGVSPIPPEGYLCDNPDTGRYFTGSESIDDLEIWVEIAPIDGLGKVLGYAGHCGLVVGGTFRSVTGEMFFDIDDVESLLMDGSLVDVISHEMGHVLGIGSFWGAPYRGLVVAPNYQYTGSKGIEGYREVMGLSSGSPPVELDGGTGTALSHWDENTFGNELMSGYISTQGNPLSRMTAKALIDLGYIVNANNADLYVAPVGRRRLRGNDHDGKDKNKTAEHKHRMFSDSSAFHRKKNYPIVEVVDFH